MKAGKKTWEEKVLEENKNNVSIETVKKQFNKKMKEGAKAFKFLDPTASNPKQQLTAPMTLNTRKRA